MREFRDIWMASAIKGNERLVKELESIGGDRATALLQLYRKYIPLDVEITRRYDDIVQESKLGHIIIETDVVKTLDFMVKAYGWREVVSGWILYAKNKKENLRRAGLHVAIPDWDKVIELVKKFPKEPQQ